MIKHRFFKIDLILKLKMEMSMSMKPIKITNSQLIETIMIYKHQVKNQEALKILKVRLGLPTIQRNHPDPEKKGRSLKDNSKKG